MVSSGVTWDRTNPLADKVIATEAATLAGISAIADDIVTAEGQIEVIQLAASGFRGVRCGDRGALIPLRLGALQAVRGICRVNQIFRHEWLPPYGAMGPPERPSRRCDFIANCGNVVTHGHRYLTAIVAY